MHFRFIFVLPWGKIWFGDVYESLHGPDDENGAACPLLEVVSGASRQFLSISRCPVCSSELTPNHCRLSTWSDISCRDWADVDLYSFLAFLGSEALYKSWCSQDHPRSSSKSSLVCITLLRNVEAIPSTFADSKQLLLFPPLIKLQ